MTYQNKTIWITGASAGIGEAFAYAFAKEGANLILSSRNEKELQRVKSNCKEAGTVWVVPIDLVQYETIGSTVEKTLSEVGQVDMLINNGGISQRSLVKDTLLEVDKRIFDVNYFGAIAMTKAVLPYMMKRKSGTLVVISSVAGKLSTPLRSAYCASKHAIRAFYDSMRTELIPYNIQVTIICPGLIKTDISKNAVKGDGSKYNKMDQGQANGMPVEECVRQSIAAIRSGKEEVIISGIKEKFGVYMKRFFPRLFSIYISKIKVT